MPITFLCGSCQTKLKVADKFAGKKARCTKCGVTVEIPNSPHESDQLTEQPIQLSSHKGKTSPARRDLNTETVTHTRPASPHPVPQRVLANETLSSPVKIVSPQNKPSPSLAGRGFSDEAILRSISAPIVEVPTTWGYTLAMAAVALVMVLLPLLYVGMIFGLGWGTIRYTSFAITSFSEMMNTPGRGSRGAAFIFAPIAIAAVAIFFMVKPLLARPSKQGEKIVLDRKNEPLLFAYIEKLCQCVHAPTPKRIDLDHEVNASASLRKGLWSIFRRQDLVLTIGLPLVNGLTLRQFSGVLAHEFGHFSQGMGMRLSYVIRSVNAWFARVVYERDAWDERLKSWATGIDLRVGIVLYAAMFFVWLTRRILWCFMMIGHGLSCMLMRQMEYDADLHEIRFAGTEAFVSTCEELGPLAVSSHMALNEVAEFFQDGKLVDDLPQWIQIVRKDLPAEILNELKKSDQETKTNWFDTHPANRDRIAAAKKWNSTGKIEGEFPAAALFRQLNFYQKQTTITYYREIFGDEFRPEMLASVDLLKAHRNHAKASQEATIRWFGKHFGLPRAIPLPSLQFRGQPTSQLLEQLTRSRHAMQTQLGGYEELSQSLMKADDGWVQALQAATFLRSGLILKPKDWPNLNVTNLNTVAQAETQFRSECEQIHHQLIAFEKHIAIRTDAALQLLLSRAPQININHEQRDAWLAKSDQLLPPLTAMNNIFSYANTLRNDFVSLAGLLQSIAGKNASEKVNVEFKRLINSLNHMLENIRPLLMGVTYPFEHSEKSIDLQTYLLPKHPDPEDPTSTIVASEHFISNYGQLYFRTFGSLAFTVEQIESCLLVGALDSAENFSIHPISHSSTTEDAFDTSIASVAQPQHATTPNVVPAFTVPPASCTVQPASGKQISNAAPSNKKTWMWAGLGLGCLGLFSLGIAFVASGFFFSLKFNSNAATDMNSASNRLRPPAFSQPPANMQQMGPGFPPNPSGTQTVQERQAAMDHAKESIAKEFHSEVNDLLNSSLNRDSTTPSFPSPGRFSPFSNSPRNIPSESVVTTSQGPGRTVTKMTRTGRDGVSEIRIILNDQGHETVWESPKMDHTNSMAMSVADAIRIMDTDSEPQQLSRAYRCLALSEPSSSQKQEVIQAGIRSTLNLPKQSDSDLPTVFDGVWAMLHWTTESESNDLVELLDLPNPASTLVLDRIIQNATIEQSAKLLGVYTRNDRDPSTERELEQLFLKWGPQIEDDILTSLQHTNDFPLQTRLLRLLEQSCGTDKSIRFLSETNSVKEFFAKSSAKKIQRRLSSKN